jgi:integrase
MAVIEQRYSKSGATSWRVKIRVKGCKSESASFKRRTDAKRWATKTEASILDGKYFKHTQSKRLTLSDAIRPYSDEILGQLKDPFTRLQHLNYWEKEIGAVLLADIQTPLIIDCRANLKHTHSNSTANRYVATLSALLSFVTKNRQWLESNPCLLIEKLKEPKGRTRFLSSQERNNLINACKNCTKYPEMQPITLLAITTGMRRGEILNLRWGDISFKTQRIILWNTKNDETRAVPLVGPAFQALQAWSKIRPINNDALVFPSRVEGNSSNVFHLDHAWRLVKRDAGLTDFRFHDLRHTAASYLAMNGAGLRELADILGHKTLAMVMRYSHITHDHKHQTVSRMTEAVFGGN